MSAAAEMFEVGAEINGSVLPDPQHPRVREGVLLVDGIEIYEASGTAFTPYGPGHYTVSDSEVATGEQFGVIFGGFLGVESAYDALRREWAARGVTTLTIESMRVL